MVAFLPLIVAAATTAAVAVMILVETAPTPRNNVTITPLVAPVIIAILTPPTWQLPVVIIRPTSIERRILSRITTSVFFFSHGVSGTNGHRIRTTVNGDFEWRRGDPSGNCHRGRTISRVAATNTRTLTSLLLNGPPRRLGPLPRLLDEAAHATATYRPRGAVDPDGGHPASTSGSHSCSLGPLHLRPLLLDQSSGYAVPLLLRVQEQLPELGGERRGVALPKEARQIQLRASGVHLLHGPAPLLGALRQK